MELTKKIINKFFSQTKEGYFLVGEGDESIKFYLNFEKAQTMKHWHNHIVLDIPDMELFYKKVDDFLKVAKRKYIKEKNI